jgi:phospholipase C
MRFTRSKFLSSSATAATLGLTACGGGAAVGGSAPPSVSGSAPTAAPGASPTPAPSPTGSSTSAPTQSTATFPNGTISSGGRGPNSLPDPTRAAGVADTKLPFDNVIIIMMENHSFDNYFGMLPLRGQPLADGFTFDGTGKPTNKNPLSGGYQHVFHITGTCAPFEVSQDWNNTHKQVNVGAMDGFAATCDAAMGYWDESDLPFYYSLAKTYCVGNRSYCSTQGQTYPNRRYLYSATSGGLVSTSDTTFTMPYPTNGTLMDMMSNHGVTWKDYITDIPTLGIIPETVEKYPTNFATIAQFLVDCAAGTLPNVSFVECGFNATTTVGEPLYKELMNVPNLPPAIVSSLAEAVNAEGTSEENPTDIAIGEQFVSKVMNAVFASPQWKSTLMIWTYDEHGGYYDHVVPAAAVEPDGIAPNIATTDYQASFNVTGVRVPTVVVSPYAKPNAVSNVPHDHTAIIATIAAKWNLPALTYRDAQSATLFDYCDFTTAHFATPPTLAAPAGSAEVKGDCASGPPPATISPSVVPVPVRAARPKQRL